MSNAHLLIESEIRASLRSPCQDRSLEEKIEKESWVLAQMSCYELVHPKKEKFYEIDGWLTNVLWQAFWVRELVTISGKEEKDLANLVDSSKLEQHLTNIFESLKKELDG